MLEKANRLTVAKRSFHMDIAQGNHPVDTTWDSLDTNTQSAYLEEADALLEDPNMAPENFSIYKEEDYDG